MRFNPIVLLLTTVAAREAPVANSRSTTSQSKPRISRRSNSFWDHVVEGSKIQTATNTHAKEISSYTLRAKENDPSTLGVDTVKQYSGYLDDDDEDKHLFYWFFESRNDPENDPVVLWLNGGPGCSSLIGLFTELGPARISKEDLKPVNNPYSWNSNASVIFLDQPVNVGYSYGGKDATTTAAASKDVYALLTLFFEEFPQYAKQDFHIAGESYAGHYIPIFTKDILSHSDRNINLKSSLIGNGLTDGYTQYAYYQPMACGKGGYDAVLDTSQCEEMEDAIPECQSRIKKCYDDTSDVEACEDAYSFCNSAMFNPYQNAGNDVYDVRRNGTTPPDYSTDFLSLQETKDALGVEVEGDFSQCNGNINQEFAQAGDWMLPIQKSIPDILKQIPVLVYAGDADYICNWLGNRAWTEALPWSGQDEFKNAAVNPLQVGADDTEYGTVKSAQNFAFMRIYEAGHTVPEYQPEASLDFFNRWLSGEWWST